MTKDNIKDSVELVEGIQASYADETLTFKGPKGEMSKRLIHPEVDIKIEGGRLTLAAHGSRKRDKTMVGTFKAHVRNMMEGVQEGYTYKLKICAGHFPMNVSVNGDQFVVKNFLGEKVPRTVKLRKDASVKVDGDTVVVESVDKEVAGQTAADIEQLTRVKNKDRRIFQDGIFIIQKGRKLIG